MGESLIIEELDGDHALMERFEDGVRVTDVSFDPVGFRYDSYQIDGAEVGKLNRVADYLRGEGGVNLVVEGHCDERGSREYNMSLGEHRALAVRAYLIGLGVDSARIQTRSYGEEKPIDMGHNDAAWTRNRRGEFALYR
ncbi:MAG: OmpA family protein [Kiritimatiellae bacterium]|nr:OmpA family protein [Kiritimatiellia bacterium]